MVLKRWTPWDPAEIIGELPEAFRLHICSLTGGMVTSAQGLRVDTVSICDIPLGGVLLIPGGVGTRTLVMNEQILQIIKAFVKKQRDDTLRLHRRSGAGENRFTKRAERHHQQAAV